MSTPSFEVVNWPTTTSYAASTTGGNVNLTGTGSFYHSLPEGVSTLTVSSQRTGLTVHLTTSYSSSNRYVTRTVKAGETLVLSNIAVPPGESRYMNIQANGAGDVGVTIITWPPATQ